MRTPSMTGSRHLLSDELLDLVHARPTTDLTLDNIIRIRAAAEAMAGAEREFREQFPPEDNVVATECVVPHCVPGEPPVRMLVYTPTGGNHGTRPCYVSIHGGGYVVGSPDQHDHRHREIARTHGCVVVAPAYRLAPENPYPAGLNDCLSAVHGAHAKAAELGIDRNTIVVGGESAGGGLAAAVALSLRDSSDIVLAGQVLVYPMLDDRTGTTHDPSPLTGEFLWTRSSNSFAWRCYLGDAPGDDAGGYAAPARAENLSGLPPCHIFVGALDLFREESVDYAERLMKAGVPTSLHVYAGACHAFDLAPLASLTRRFKTEFDEALAGLFRGTASAQSNMIGKSL